MGAASLAVGVVDDHPAISAGVANGLVADLPDGSTFALHTDLEGLLTERHLDVVLLDLSLGDDSEPVENVRRVLARGWHVLIYTQVQHPGQLAKCLRAGALGVVGKHQQWSVLAEAVIVVARGQAYLNAQWATAMEALEGTSIPSLAPREAEVLRLYAAGLPLKSVARQVGVAEQTAKEYLVRVRRKYEEAGRPAPTKTHLLRRAVEDGHLGLREVD